MTEIEEAIRRVQAQKREIEEQIAAMQRLVDGFAGELRGLEHARELFPEEDAPPDKRERLDIQRPVMAAFNASSAWTEAALVRETDLPRLAVRKYLARAVRDGNLVCEEGVYTMPRKSKQQAAE